MRPCPGDGIGQLSILEGGKTIYTATLKQGIGAADLPLATSIPNYSVTGSFPTAAEAVGRSFLARATGSSGVYLGAYAFNYDSLKRGLVTTGHTKYETVETFQQRKGNMCG